MLAILIFWKGNRMQTEAWNAEGTIMQKTKYDGRKERRQVCQKASRQL